MEFNLERPKLHYTTINLIKPTSIRKKSMETPNKETLEPTLPGAPEKKLPVFSPVKRESFFEPSPLKATSKMSLFADVFDILHVVKRSDDDIEEVEEIIDESLKVVDIIVTIDGIKISRNEMFEMESDEDFDEKIDDGKKESEKEL